MRHKVLEFPLQRWSEEKIAFTEFTRNLEFLVAPMLADGELGRMNSNLGFEGFDSFVARLADRLSSEMVHGRLQAFVAPGAAMLSARDAIGGDGQVYYRKADLVNAAKRVDYGRELGSLLHRAAEMSMLGKEPLPADRAWIETQQNAFHVWLAGLTSISANQQISA